MEFSILSNQFEIDPFERAKREGVPDDFPDERIVLPRVRKSWNIVVGRDGGFPVFFHLACYEMPVSGVYLMECFSESVYMVEVLYYLGLEGVFLEYLPEKSCIGVSFQIFREHLAHPFDGDIFFLVYGRKLLGGHFHAIPGLKVPDKHLHIVVHKREYLYSSYIRIRKNLLHF